MYSTLRSEHISKRLKIAMFVIVFSLLSISIPLIVSSYQSYIKSKQSLSEIQCLRMLADIANQISRERAPANHLMAASPSDYPKKLAELTAYRQTVDIRIKQTVQALELAGFPYIVDQISQDLQPSLRSARHAVDEYARLPQQQRKALAFDHAIRMMFTAWDESHESLKIMINHSKGKDSIISNYYTLILMLADMRDQAGRTASNIIAWVSFNQAIPETNLASSLQTQRQTEYLWELVNVVQAEQDKTPIFQELHRAVRTEFLEKGLPIINILVNESLEGQPYSLNASQLTEKIVDKFVTVVDLQNYMVDYSVKVAQDEKNVAQRKLILTSLLFLLSLTSVLLTMIYAQKWVFEPVIYARDLLIELSERGDQRIGLNSQDSSEKSSLFDAIKRLERMLQQRDALEFQLRNIANTDTLTNVSNRAALDDYIKHAEKKSERFTQTGLIILDIDDFKYVNDTFGHIVGDEVIKLVAEKLQFNVRTSDLIVRYGGDEFLVLIDHVDYEDALLVAKKIVVEIAEASMYVPEVSESISISVSAGVAVGAGSWMALLEKADKSLFQAKQNGKNKVEG